jgi:hypothetical protein
MTWYSTFVKYSFGILGSEASDLRNAPGQGQKTDRGDWQEETEIAEHFDCSKITITKSTWWNSAVFNIRNL